LLPSGLQQTKQFGQSGLTSKNVEVNNLKRRAARPAVLFFVRRYVSAQELQNE
jgi:hypothetical protein